MCASCVLPSVTSSTEHSVCTMHDAVLLNNSPLLPCMYSTRRVCAKYKCQWGYGIISIKDLVDSHK